MLTLKFNRFAFAVTSKVLSIIHDRKCQAMSQALMSDRVDRALVSLCENMHLVALTPKMYAHNAQCVEKFSTVLEKEFKHFW